MKRLGAIIAGGKATRFGGDKAAALLNGRPLIEHVADGLREQVDRLIICGRAWPEMDWVEDRPSADLGPLGGLNAALHYAQQNGFDYVLTAGCDVLPVPHFPDKLASENGAFIADHYLFGIWPTSLSDALNRYLIDQSDRSMRGWIKSIGAQLLPTTLSHANLNTPADLNAYAKNPESR